MARRFKPPMMPTIKPHKLQMKLLDGEIVVSHNTLNEPHPEKLFN
jgi:hypothetical protein